MRIKTIIVATLTAASLTAGAQVTINVSSADGAKDVSPMLYGIFFEEINRAGDGGLYAELVANRSFEDNKEEAERWSVSGDATMQLTSADLLNTAQNAALEVTFGGTADGTLANSGYWGINAVQGTDYKLSFYAKGSLKYTDKTLAAADKKSTTLPITVRLMDESGKDTIAETTIEGNLSSKEWQKYTATLTATSSCPKAQLQLSTGAKGTVCFDMVSLFPPTFKNRENGCRADLAELLYAMHPKFMRFPGGCYVEGQESPDNAFRWERTIGPIEERPGHLNRNWSYYVSDGLGFHEFLQLAEDLGAKPLYVVNIGLWHGGMTPYDSIQPWIDECLGALEYANGPVTSKYGAMRAANGHPEPFNIEYLEIGNENNQDDPRQQSDHYYDRYNAFREAVLAEYPDMHIIGNVVAWGNDEPKWNSTLPVDLLDEHYYRTPGWFAENFQKYDFYDRTGPEIYCGEYAVTNGFGTLGNLNAGLGEAVFMMGMENNSDIVTMASYAPIFVNENNVCWMPDMIRFNASKVMCTPSYYVQKLMAENVGTKILNVEQKNPYNMVDSRMICPEECRVGYATWGTNASFQFVSLETSEGNETSSTEPVRGNWNTNGDIVSQESMGEGDICLSTKTFSTEGGYTYKAKARKDAGVEGFMLVFNYQDANNYCWLNFGGWGNTSHAIEQVVDGGKLQTAMVPGRVEEGKWYDITLKVDGDSVEAWIDGEQVFSTRLKTVTYYGVYSSATYDEPTGETIVKVVNTSGNTTSALIDVDGKTISEARLIRLASKSGADENSLDNPTNVYPTEQTLFPNADGKIGMDLTPYSLNILRIK